MFNLGKRYADNFDAFPKSKHIFLKSKGPRAMTRPVEIYEQINKPLARLNTEEDWKEPQRDHICELGVFTILADSGPPKGVTEEAWKPLQDAIGGEGSGVNASLNRRGVIPLTKI